MIDDRAGLTVAQRLVQARGIVRFEILVVERRRVQGAAQRSAPLDQELDVTQRRAHLAFREAIDQRMEELLLGHDPMVLIRQR